MRGQAGYGRIGGGVILAALLSVSGSAIANTADPMQRLLREHRDVQDLWTPADSVGNVGAAMVPLMVGWALTAFEKGYSPGNPLMIEASGDDGGCGAAVFRSAERRAAA